MKKYIVLALFVISLAPFGTVRANPIGDIWSRINSTIKISTSLLKQLTQLKSKQVSQTASVLSSVSQSIDKKKCINLSNNLKYSSQDAKTNGEVTKLQNFLRTQGYLSSESSGYYGWQTVNAVKKFQKAYGIEAVGYLGSTTRAKIKSISCSVSDTQTPTNLNLTDRNLNLGVISVRAIVVNVDEVGDSYGSYGMKFSQSKLNDVEQALQKLNTFVKKSSYGQTKLQWTTSGVYELGKGVCDNPSYGEKVNDLIQRALVASDSQSQLTDYSYYLIVHPMPDCQDGESWSYEGAGQFKAYSLNGRTVHLRGIHISDLSEQYLFHEFGHTLAYKENTGIGHPDYLNCPVTTKNGETKISLTSTCPRIYNYSTNELPVFSMMSSPSTLADFSSIEKEIIGWLSGSDIITTTSGTYTLSPLELNGSGPKALKVPIAGTNYIVYVSFRQPDVLAYPNYSNKKPKGVILDISNGSVGSFLVTNNSNKNSSLEVGVPYRIGNGPVIKVNSISNNSASITVSTKATPSVNTAIIVEPISQPSSEMQNTNDDILPNTPVVVAPIPTCSIKSNKSVYKFGDTITYSWTSQNATYASWYQDTSGKDHLWLPGDKLLTSGSQNVTANVVGNPSVTLLINNKNGSSSCSKTVSVESITIAPQVSQSVSFKSSTFMAVPNYEFTLSGGSSAQNGELTVAIVDSKYSGGTDWNSIGSLLKGGSYIAVSKTVSLSNSSWSATFSGVPEEGYYTVLVYDASYNLLGKSTLWVTFKG